MKNLVRFLLVSALIIICGHAYADQAKNPGYKVVTLPELQALMKDKQDLVVIDSRGGKYYDGEVIKGAANLPADKTDKSSLAALIKTKGTPVVFYCSDTSCGASASAAHTAHEAGYKNIYKFPGGIAEWKQNGLPTTKLN